MLEDSESKECLHFVETSINRQVAAPIYSFYPSNFTWFSVILKSPFN